MRDEIEKLYRRVYPRRGHSGTVEGTDAHQEHKDGEDLLRSEGDLRPHIDAEVAKKLFYKMYPDSDPKYFERFRLVYTAHSRNIEVRYKKEDGSEVIVVRGMNDEDPRWKRFLHRYNFPKVWRPGGTVKEYIHLKQNLGYQLHHFRLYVNDKEYFMSKLPPVSASWSKKRTINETTIYDIRKAPFDYVKEPYCAMISAAYIATYLCGVSMEHLSPSRSSNVPNLKTTIMRYHLYYTIRRFMNVTMRKIQMSNLCVCL